MRWTCRVGWSRGKGPGRDVGGSLWGFLSKDGAGVETAPRAGGVWGRFRGPEDPAEGTDGVTPDLIGGALWGGGC